MSTVIRNLPGTDIEEKKWELFLSILLMARFCPTFIERIERWSEEIAPLIKEISEWSPSEVTPHECGFSQNIPNSFDFIVRVAFFAPLLLVEWQK